MQKHVGHGCLTLIHPIAVQGRLIKYLDGYIRVDFMGVDAAPLYEVHNVRYIEQFNTEHPEPTVDLPRSVLIPAHNVAGVVWTKKEY